MMNISRYILCLSLQLFRLRGEYASIEELERLLTSTFSDTVACVGNPELSEQHSSVIKVSVLLLVI